MRETTFICTEEKCLLDHKLYRRGMKVVRPIGWKNSNFQPLTPMNMDQTPDKPDTKIIGGLPGQGPQETENPLPTGGPHAFDDPPDVNGNGKITVAELTKYLKDNNVSIPADSRDKASLQNLVDQHKATVQQ